MRGNNEWGKKKVENDIQSTGAKDNLGKEGRYFSGKKDERLNIETEKPVSVSNGTD